MHIVYWNGVRSTVIKLLSEIAWLSPITTLICMQLEGRCTFIGSIVPLLIALSLEGIPTYYTRGGPTDLLSKLLLIGYSCNEDQPGSDNEHASIGYNLLMNLP